nr:MAG TPA_asm: hypothetical protein [Caudoviricetes sp.]
MLIDDRRTRVAIGSILPLIIGSGNSPRLRHK